MSFQDLNLHPQILRAIEESGYTSPTPIQLQAIPHIMAGLDLQASSQTGSGKTAAFILPSLNRIVDYAAANPNKGKGPLVLILVPTRELAVQVSNQAIKYSKHLSKVKTVCLYGGVPYPNQNRDLSRPYEILVATPGRLIDHMERGRINFSRLQMLILDEADRMLDMGFIQPVEQIAANIPNKRQTLLFSATLKPEVLRLSKRLLNHPLEIAIEAEQVNKQAHIEQKLFFADDREHKLRLLDHILNHDDNLNQVIIFTSTKAQADQLADVLHEQNYDSSALHGDLNQRQRTRTLKQLREGKIRILVATDVAARGIDIPTISHVINFDLPNSVEDYVHRIGRTGRAGAKGIALSFVESRTKRMLREIEAFTGSKISLQTIPGLEPRARDRGDRENNDRQKRRRPPFGGKKKFPSRHGNRFSKGGSSSRYKEAVAH